MPETGRDFVQSLERGLGVILCFSEESPRQTLSDVARHTGFSRAARRRLLHTLETLGYVGQDGREFYLLLRILDVGYSYLSSLPFRTLVAPYIEELGAKVNESVSVSVSVSVLDGADIVYVSRVATSRIMTVSINIGNRLPVYCTSMGRVLLASMPVVEQRRHLSMTPLTPHTKFSLRSEKEILAEIARVAKRGWSLNDQELEIGPRSIAAPITDAGGRTVAAMNIATHAGPTPMKELREKLLPQLLATTKRVNTQLEKRRRSN